MTTQTFSPFRNMVLAVVASAAVLGFAAVPAEASEVRTASIEVGQYDLTRSEGRAAVQVLVLNKARELCALGGVDQKDLSETASQKLCVANALRDARIQMIEIAGRTQVSQARMTGL